MILQIAEGCGRVWSGKGWVKPMGRIEHIVEVDLVFKRLRCLVEHVLDGLSGSWHLCVEIISEFVSKSRELRSLEVFLEQLIATIKAREVDLVELVVVQGGHLRQSHQVVLVLEGLLQLLLQLESCLLVQQVQVQIKWVLLSLSLRRKQEHQLLILLLLLLRVIGELLEQLVLQLVIREAIEVVGTTYPTVVVQAVASEVVPRGLIPEEGTRARVRLLGRVLKHVHVHRV